MEASSTTEPFRFSADVAGDLRTAERNRESHRSGDHFPQRGEADALVLETKREIRRLVQEIAALCHSRLPAGQFWPRFLADVGTAMAADGGILWQRRAGDWISIAHHGPIDRRLLVNPTPIGPGKAAPRPNCHELMICEVAHGGGPVIVPPGGAWETPAGEATAEKSTAAAEPGNPTESLAAVVPIPVDPDEPVEWMIELFLPLGGGPATHRGYLRFAAQMADLAADYLRRERLREARWRADQASRMHETIVTLYRSGDRQTAEQRIVDAAAKIFAAERVSLVSRRNHRWTVVAVSGVEQIDPALPAVQAIREIAAEVTGPVGFIPAESDAEESKAPSPETQPPEQASTASTVGNGADPEASSGALTLRGVAIVDAEEDTRLVVEDRALVDVDLDQLQHWSLFLTHAELVLRHCERLRAAGLRGWLQPSRYGVRVRFGRSLTAAAVAVGIVVLGALPVPMVVTAEARLEPRQVQILYAPRDAVVAEMWIEHGDQVQTGDALLRLVDSELDRSLNALLGRRAVLTERAAELRARLVSRTVNDADEAERLQTEQRVTSEELRSVAAELVVLEEERERLVLRSDRSGLVDAWQIRERLANRPVRRGQSLFRIVAPDGGWLIEADVPQNRLDHVIASEQNGPTRGEVVLTAFPDRAVSGQLEKIGPAAWMPGGGQSPASLAAATPSMGAEPTGTVTFSVDPDDLPLLQAGAPAKIGIDCGYRPLAYVACQDLVRTVVGWLRLYW